MPHTKTANIFFFARRTIFLVGLACVVAVAALAQAPGRYVGSRQRSARISGAKATARHHNVRVAQAKQVPRSSNTQERPRQVSEVPPKPENLPSPSEKTQSPGRPQRHTIRLSTSPDTGTLKVENHGKLISLIVRDVPLRDVLTMIAKTQHLNLVLAIPGNERVTVNLDRVSLQQALDALIAVGGYTSIVHDGIIYVTSIEAAAMLPPTVQGSRLAVLELDYASAIDVDLVVKGMLSPIGKSFITQSSPSDNRRTREIVVVEDLPAYVARIESYISQIDQPPRQVLIEVHILQIDLKDDMAHGVNFEALSKIANTNISIGTTGFANPAAPQAFFFETTGGNLLSLIEVLQQTTDVKTLASPLILALNGQEARIQIGEQLGFRVTTTTETSTLESVEFLDVGVVLSITPRITRDGYVLMHIKPEESSGSVNPETGLPEEETTEVETDVLLKDGQAMIIGGLIQERDTNIQSKIPFLGDLAYVGALFQRRQVVKLRSEIIVAIVPHILPLNPGPESRDRFDVNRTMEPLTAGAIHRYPRPYEPRMPDTFYNPRPIWRRSRPLPDVSPVDAASDAASRREIQRLPIVVPSFEPLESHKSRAIASDAQSWQRPVARFPPQPAGAIIR